MHIEVVLIAADGKAMTCAFTHDVAAAIVKRPVYEGNGRFGQQLFYLSGERDAAGRPIYRPRLQ